MSNNRSSAQVQYLRAQAELSLTVATQTGDVKTAEKLRAEAARYHAVASDIETRDAVVAK